MYGPSWYILSMFSIKPFDAYTGEKLWFNKIQVEHHQGRTSFALLLVLSLHSVQNYLYLSAKF